MVTATRNFSNTHYKDDIGNVGYDFTRHTTSWSYLIVISSMHSQWRNTCIAQTSSSRRQWYCKKLRKKSFRSQHNVFLANACCYDLLNQISFTATAWISVFCALLIYTIPCFGQLELTIRTYDAKYQGWGSLSPKTHETAGCSAKFMEVRWK